MVSSGSSQQVQSQGIWQVTFWQSTAKNPPSTVDARRKDEFWGKAKNSGASGAGKSTLMNILSGRKGLGDLSGEISFLGRGTTSDLSGALNQMQHAVAYIPQLEAFFPMQTPYEAVQFIASLVHGKNATSSSEIVGILSQVGLGDPLLYSRLIGGNLPGGIVIPGLSGGEKKRLALACALIARPTLLMIDEITSGLDSENALMIMALVKQVCVNFGVAALVVIHQPNGHIFDLFDRLIILAHGQCVYSNEINRSNNFFLEEFYHLHLHRGMPTSSHEIPLDLLKHLKKPLDGDFGKDVAFVPSSLYNRKWEIGQTAEKETRAEKHVVTEHWKAFVVLRRNLINHYARDPTNMLARVLVYGSLGVVNGCMYWKVGESDKLASVLGAFTFTALACYLLPFAMLASFVHDKQFFISERAMGLYSPWIYCCSHMLLELWMNALVTLVNAAIVVPMDSFWNDASPSWSNFLTFYSVMALSGLNGASIILFFCALVKSQDLAFILGSGYITVCLGLSGGFVPAPEIGGFIRWLQWVNPIKYTLQGLALATYKGTEQEAALDTLELNRPDTVSENLGALALIYSFFAVATVFVLVGTRERK